MRWKIALILKFLEALGIRESVTEPRRRWEDLLQQENLPARAFVSKGRVSTTCFWYPRVRFWSDNSFALVQGQVQWTLFVVPDSRTQRFVDFSVKQYTNYSQKIQSIFHREIFTNYCIFIQFSWLNAPFVIKLSKYSGISIFRGSFELSR